MPYSELTYKHLNNLKQKIQEDISTNNMNNTGGASQSLEIQENKLLGNDYIYYLAHGSAPWKNPENWKGLGFYMQKDGWNKVNPYAAAYKIAHEGNAVFRKERQGLQIDKLVNDTINDLTKELPDYAAAEALKWL